MSSSNCCDPWGFHLFLRKSDGAFAPRRRVTFARPDMPPGQRLWRDRGHNRPHLLDWDRDGRADLVIEDGPYLSGRWDLQVAAGPLKAGSEVGVGPSPMPALPGRNPYDAEFADWDGDGLTDVLVAGSYLADEKKGPWLYDIYWLRNTSRRGGARFDPPVRLLTAPGQSGGWGYDGYAVVGRGRAGRQDLVVSVSKDWRRNPEGGWANRSQLVLYRRSAEPPLHPTGPASRLSDGLNSPRRPGG